MLTIRDLTVAAPLKRGGHRRRVQPGVAAIRDLTVAAPLKHWNRCHPDRLGGNNYPRPDGRGPIEATPSAARAGSGTAIRDLTVAAPLKQTALLMGKRLGFTIRDLTVAAPLKLERRPRRW